MELTILSVPDCPNAALLQQRLAEVLGERGDVVITQRTVTTEDGHPAGDAGFAHVARRRA